MNRRELNRATLARQGLLARERWSPVDAVERLTGMQAQEPRPPFIGLWSRIDGFAADELRAALRDREVFRATSIRATLHLMSAADYSAFRTALQPALDAAMNSILKARGDGIPVAAVVEAGRKLLTKRPLTFDEIRDALRQEFPNVDHRALGYVVRTSIPLAMVATDDVWAFPREARFQLVEPGERDATDDLVCRYLAAYGPASPADMQTWSGLRALKTAFERLGDELEPVGGGLYDLPAAPRPDPDDDAPPRLLPPFDQILLAHSDRARIVADEHRPRVITRNLRIPATFTWDGFVAGIWTIHAKKKLTTIELESFGKLPKTARKDLEAEAEALVRFAEPEARDHAVGWA